MQNKTFLLDERKLSYWAFYYCKYINDDPEIKKLITEQEWSYCYCKYVKDDPEVRKNITNSYLSYLYLKNINNDPEVRKHIKNPELLKDLENEKQYILIK